MRHERMDTASAFSREWTRQPMRPLTRPVRSCWADVGIYGITPAGGRILCRAPHKSMERGACSLKNIAFEVIWQNEKHSAQNLFSVRPLMRGFGLRLYDRRCTLKTESRCRYDTEAATLHSSRAMGTAARAAKGKRTIAQPGSVQEHIRVDSGRVSLKLHP